MFHFKPRHLAPYKGRNTNALIILKIVLTPAIIINLKKLFEVKLSKIKTICLLDYFNTLKIDENKEVKIILLYNYEFNRPKNDESNITYSSYSLPVNPDYTLVIEYENNKKLLHFDAKYRVNKYNEYKEDNIHKMHTYKDGITDSIGAYILYPGNKSEVFDEIDGSFGSVGAFTLKPGETETDEKEIGKFIVGIIEGWIKDNSD